MLISFDLSFPGTIHCIVIFLCVSLTLRSGYRGVLRGSSPDSSEKQCDFYHGMVKWKQMSGISGISGESCLLPELHTVPSPEREGDLSFIVQHIPASWGPVTPLIRGQS